MNEADGDLRLVSHFPGRLRVRAGAFRADPALAQEVAGRLGAEPGVSDVRASATTGSLLVVYDPRELELPRLVALVIEAGGLRGLAADSDHVGDRLSQGTIVRERLAALNDVLKGATAGKVDLRTAVPGALAAASLGMLLGGARKLPQWYDLAMWAFTTFNALNHPERDDRLDPA